MDFVNSVITSVIGSFIFWYLSKRFSFDSKIDLPLNPKEKFQQIESSYDEIEAERIREQNRIIRDNIHRNIYFYIASFYIIGVAFFLPMLLNNGIDVDYIDFNKTKLGIDYILSKDNLILFSGVCASILFLPILFISKQIAYVWAYFKKDYDKITLVKIIFIRLLIILFLAICLGSTNHWLLNINLTWIEAFQTTLAFLFMVFIIFSNG